MKFSISKNQLFLLFFIIQTGSVFISFQEPIINEVGRDAWIVFAVFCVIQLFQLFLYEKFHSHFKIPKFLQWMYSAYWILLIVSFLAYIQKSLSVWAFPITPSYVIIGIIVALSFYANMSRPESVINLGVLLIPLIPLIFIFLTLAVPELVWTNLFPMGNISKEEWFGGTKESIHAFIGAEIYLFYRGFVVKSEKIKFRFILIYQFVLSSFYLITILFSLLFFSIDELKIIPEPLVYLLKSQEVTFIERLDLFFIIIWMSWSIITVIYLVFTVTLFMEKNAPKKLNSKKIILHLLLFILPLIIIAKDYHKVAQDMLIYGHLLFALVIPFFVIVYNKWRSKNVEKV
jgi:hypothetical protein